MDLIQKAFRFIWKSSKKIEIFIFVFLLMIAAVAISLPIGFAYGFFSTRFLLENQKTYYIASYIVYLILITLVQTVVQILPLGLYFKSFKLVLEKNLKIVNFGPLDNVVKNLKNGAKYYAVIFFYSLPLTLINWGYGIFQIVSKVNKGFNYNYSNFPWQHYIYLIIIFLFTILYSFFMIFFLRPSFTYICITEGFRSAFNPNKVIKIIGRYYKKMINIGLQVFLLRVLVIGSLLLSGILIIFCIGIFLFPIVLIFFQVIQVYIEPYLQSYIFKKIENE